MNSQRFIDGVKRGKLSRRDFHKELAAFGIGVASIPLVPRMAAAADDPTVFAWSGYEDPGFHSQYEAQHGSLPNFLQFGDEDEAFAKMRAGFQPAFTMACSYKAPHWYDAGIIKPIDVSRLPNFDDFVELLKDVPGTQFDGQRAWVCMD